MLYKDKVGNVATNPSRSDGLLEYFPNVPQTGGSSEILQWMEPTIIQNSNQKYKGLEQQKERGKQGRSPSSFYQKATSQPTYPRGEEQEKELEETIFPNSQDPKNPKGCHGHYLQHGQKLDGIQGQRGGKNEATTFSKEITLSPDSLNALTGIKNSKYIASKNY
ncbi:hypothetical protein O181_053514 [Austropuccinia psidii MF-1]|uniref:Uncharacterized protein n=1 Tax=Austropuccinia psidii MF-1 TaxID=1389203 RepID=A0A9Q3E2T8_9BASI|nr:hypothetical protein [Austropuccinia psidii MF-1]